LANITGNYPPIERVETGFWSLDRALSGRINGITSLGIPMTFIELFGFQGVGKTTFASSLMAIVANYYQKKIMYAPFEHVDAKLMGSILDNLECSQEVTLLGGWDTVKSLFPKMKQIKVTDEIILDCMLEAVRREDYCVGVLDSLSSIYTIAEAESSVADRNMGRARVISNFARGDNQANRMRESPFLTLALTHKTSPMGGGTPTNTGAPTTGGEVKKNVSKIRVGIRRVSEPAFSMDSKKTIYEEQAYILEGKVEKNNFGREGKKFFVAMLGGKGAHIGLTAMYECKRVGICTFGKSITLGKDKFGSIASVLAKAHAGQDDEFLPFITALKNPSKIEKVVDDENEFIEDEDYVEELPE
jgi:RecA/RadA recombinase